MGELLKPVNLRTDRFSCGPEIPYNQFYVIQNCIIACYLKFLSIWFVCKIKIRKMKKNYAGLGK